MPGVLFEGGSFRAIFSCGVMDALLDQDVMFPYCIGVSAGAADSASYISRQKERNLNMRCGIVMINVIWDCEIILRKSIVYLA